MQESKDTQENPTVAIFGGGSGWGMRIQQTLKEIATVQIIEKAHSIEDARRAIRECTVIFLSIPDPEIDNVLGQHAAELTSGKCVIDCATNKTGFIGTLYRMDQKGVSVCSTHPMVKSETSPRGQTVLIMPVGENSTNATNIATMIFGRMGMTAAHISIDAHQDTMVILQMIPHLIQRLLIDSLGSAIAATSFTLNDVSGVAPANYLLTELAMGRVAIQRPDVSAGIVETGLQTKLGLSLLDRLCESIQRVREAPDCRDRDSLTNFFEEGVARMDPRGEWRRTMVARTEAALARLGNLRKRSLTVTAPNVPGILTRILTVLDRHGVDMNALDSQILTNADGSETAIFEIGITDGELNWRNLTSDLDDSGATVTKREGH
jgi:prephenate dehydrogenase